MRFFFLVLISFLLSAPIRLVVLLVQGKGSQAFQSETPFWFIQEARASPVKKVI